MTIQVLPTGTKNTHHIKLVQQLAGQAAQEVGLILCDGSGRQDPRAKRADPYPRNAIKMYSGESKHSDKELPYRSLVQEDWSRGRGQEIFEDDVTRYQDSYMADTTRTGKVLLCGQPTYMTGLRNQDMQLPGNVNFFSVAGDHKYISRRFTPTTNYNAARAELWIRKKGEPTGALNVQLCMDNGIGNPGAVQRTFAILADELLSPRSVFYAFGLPPVFALVAGTDYHVKIFEDIAVSDPDNCWQVGMTWTAGTGVTRKSADGAAWGNASYDMFYRVSDDTTPFTAHFYSYKGGTYLATQPDSGAAGKVYHNGYRGVASSNVANMFRLNDATQSWAANELAGGRAEIYDGSGSAERQPWRAIVSNAATYATCSPVWYEPHGYGNEATQYVIRGLNSWRLLETGTKPFTDVCSTGELAWFACGEGQFTMRPIYRMREYANTTTWLRQWEYEFTTQATYLVAQLHPTQGWSLWLGSNADTNNEVCVRRALAPKTMAQRLVLTTPYHSGSPNGFMQEQVIPNVTITRMGNVTAKVEIAAAFTTGLVCSDQINAEDWRRYRQLWMVIQSNKSLSAGQLRLDIDNTALCGSPIETVDFPMLQAGVTYSYPPAWRQLDMEFDLATVTGADEIRSVGLTLTVDHAEDIELEVQFMYLVPGTEVIPIGDRSDKMTGMLMYGDPQELIVLKQGSAWEVSNGLAKQLAITSLKGIASADNGIANVAHDVYLFFGMRRGMVERWHRGTLDDIGPTKDMGLPTNRQGSFTCFVDFPSGIFAALDGGSDNYSSVFFFNEMGWHEIYRAPMIGQRIRSIFVEPIPGREYVRILISQGADVLWVPFGLNPLNDTSFRYHHDAEITSSRITAGKQDIPKYFKSIKLISRGLTVHQTAVVDYRVDGGTWTRVGEFTQSPTEEMSLPAGGAVGRWIEWRITLRSANATLTPQILAVVVDALEEDEPKNMYTLTWRASDKDIDLTGEPDPVSGHAKAAMIAAWQANRYPCTMYADDEAWSGKLVRPTSLSLRHIETEHLNDGLDRDVYTLVLMEV
jgi:hypothetical protein